MHSKTFRRFAALVSSALALASASSLRADDPASDHSLEAGAAYAWLQQPGGNAELAGYAAGLKYNLGKLLVTGLGLRADYRHLASPDGKGFRRDDIDADLRLDVSVVGILAPYVSAGLSFDHANTLAYNPEDGWDAGYALGAGVGITLVPGFIHTTPSVRFVSSDRLDTATCTLDTAAHFTLVGVGLRVSYEDNLSRSGSLTSAVLYATLRF
ncbi:MAG: hypothetical protein WC661_05520 [Opitutaceae bacterium]|jgi:opacity protein-like surface antigen